MAGNSSDESRFLVLGQTYLFWLDKELFPYLFGSICTLELVAGLALNTLIVIMYRKNKKDETLVLNLHFIVSDFVAFVFVILPAIGMSFSKTESIPSSLCGLLGVFNNTVFVFQFGFISAVLFAAIVAFQHEQTTLFLRRLVLLVATAVILFLAVLLAIIPFIAGERYTIQVSEYQCGTKKNEIELHIIAVFTPYFISIGLAIIMTCFGIKSALRQDKTRAVKSKPSFATEIEDKQETCQVDDNTEVDNVEPTRIIVAESGADQQHETDSQADNSTEIQQKRAEKKWDPTKDAVCTDVVIENKSHTLSFSESSEDQLTEENEAVYEMKYGLAEKQTVTETISISNASVTEKARKYTSVLKMIKGEAFCKDHDRNFIFYIVLWLIMFICWCPYTVFAFMDMYEVLWWDGWLTVGISCGYLSYCVKPIVLMTIRKDLRQKSVKLLPDTLTQRAKQLQSKLRHLV